MSAQPREDYAAPAKAIGHQVLRRELNEQISSLNHKFGVEGPETIDVVCECVSGNCDARITITVADYERLRRFPTHFCVKEGHEMGDEERIVSQASDYVVVEVRGRAGLCAVRTDPRGSHRRSDEVGV